MITLIIGWIWISMIFQEMGNPTIGVVLATTLQGNI